MWYSTQIDFINKEVLRNILTKDQDNKTHMDQIPALNGFQIAMCSRDSKPDE